MVSNHKIYWFVYKYKFRLPILQTLNQSFIENKLKNKDHDQFEFLNEVQSHQKK